MTDTDMAIVDPIDEALLVRIQRDTSVEDVAAQLGSWYAVSLAGTEPAFRILPQVKKRHRATVTCTNNGAANSTLLTQTPLGSNGVFTSAPFKVPPGVTSLVASSVSDQAGVIQILVQTPTGFVQLNHTGSNGVNNLNTIVSPGMVIEVSYVNGATAQANLALSYQLVGGAVLLGKNNQMSNAQGFILPVGNTVVVESAAEVWCLPLASCGLSVEDEQFIEEFQD